MDGSISRAEHEEFRRRLEEENRRQDKRIELLEDNMRELNQLTASVGKLASSIESMVKEQEKQGRRLETLEDLRRDGARRHFHRLYRAAAWFELRKEGFLLTGKSESRIRCSGCRSPSARLQRLWPMPV